MGATRLPGIDALRGLAVLLVTGVHLWLAGASWHRTTIGPLDVTPYFLFGSAGVSLFFVISGFCLYHPLVGVKRPDWRRFYLRRALRILPPYLVAIAILFPLWGVGARWQGWLPALASHLGFVHSLSPVHFNTVSGPLWSLGTEVHYYLLFPLLALAIRRWPVPTLVLAAASSVTIQALAGRGGFYSTDGLTAMRSVCWMCSLPARWVEFTAGMLAGVIVHQEQRVRPWLPLAWIVGLGGLVIAPLVHAHFQPAATLRTWWWGDILVAPCWAALVIAAGSSKRSLGWWQPLATLGLISYSMYLYNLVFQWVVPAVFPALAPGTTWWWPASLLTTIACGGLGYLAVERPTMSWRARLRTSPKPSEPPLPS